MKSSEIKRLSILAIALLTIAALPSRAGMCNRETSSYEETTIEQYNKLKKKKKKKKKEKETVAQQKKVPNKTTTKTKGKVEKGEASYYADKFHGRPTASGEKYNKKAFTAAHKTLPFGTKVRVTNLNNNKSVDVIINDRGPFKAGRIIDLSRAAAEKIGLINDGVAKVTVEVL